MSNIEPETKNMANPTDTKAGAETLATVKTNGDSIPKKETLGFINISPGPTVQLSKEATDHLTKIQGILKMPLWLIVHDGDEKRPMGSIDMALWKQLYENKRFLKQGEPIALILHSPGGDAEIAYRIAKLLRNHCDSFVVIAPQYVKSASTLLSLGAEKIKLGKDGDLGPLDVQIYDPETEDQSSALDEVHSTSELFQFARNQVVYTTTYWTNILKKKRQTILPLAVDYVTKMMNPLLSKIDPVHYISLTRALRIAEEYAIRLLYDRYGPNARGIARAFVEKYPYHGFIIDAKEAKSLGLDNIENISDELQQECDALLNLIEANGDYYIGSFYTQTQ